MKHFVLAAVIAAVCSPACAQQVNPDVAIKVLSEGRILSFADISKYGPDPVLQFPTGSRTHELFVLDNGAIYLCYLVGSNQSGTAPLATCFGKP